MWSSYDTCKSIIEEEWHKHGCWNIDDPIHLSQKATKDSMATLTLCSKEEFKGRENKLKKLKKQLQSLKEKKVQYEFEDEIKWVERHIHNILADEEIFWKQQSRADRLKEGDKNTKFLHHKALSRKKKNRIWGIEDETRRWIENVEEMEYEFCTYFTNLFTTSRPSQNQIAAALSRITLRLSNDMNEKLDKPFSTEAVVEALAQMCPTKTLGPDGLLAVFYKKTLEND